VQASVSFKVDMNQGDLILEGVRRSMTSIEMGRSEYFEEWYESDVAEW
jgi:hypothetical protein